MLRAQKHSPVEKRVEAIRSDLEALQGDVRNLVVDLRDAATSRAVRVIRPAAKTLDTISARLNGAVNGKNGHGPSRELVVQAATIALSLTAGVVVGGLVMRR